MAEELALVEPSPLLLIQRAIDKGTSMEQLKDLVELARQMKADRAAELWAEAVTKFQGLCPMVKKNRRTTGGKFQFSYASLDDVMDVARPHLKECGLVVSFTSRPAPIGADGKSAGYEITCLVRYGTHVEGTTVTLPCPSLSSMDAVQQFGSVVSYGKRYALCAALNIIVSDEDDDAANLAHRATPEQIQEILDCLERNGKSIESFVKWVRTFQPIEKIEDIAEANVAKIMDTINRTPKK